MIPAAECTPVALALSPVDAVRAWPADVPLAAMVSGAEGRAGRAAGERGRWSILAVPKDWAAVDPRGGLAPAAVGDGSSLSTHLPFVGGWVGMLTYELGAHLEPSVPARRDAAWPLGAWARCDSALVHDAASGRWWVVGDADELPSIARWRAGASGAAEPPAFVGPLRSQTGREAFERAVARAVEYIRAGDVFQVNLSHALAGTMRGTPRGLFASLLRTAAPWYGALLELPDDLGGGAVVSASPELFLEFDAGTRRAVTRPMKGTRAGEQTAADLLASEKDAAELNMIVDLMRNDLGRVCEYGSVRVENAREIETHGGGGVLQGVATVAGTLRQGLGLSDLLRAAFPPGSITGAPKVRAMQIIDELEARPRGPYCGCIGFVSDCGRAQLNVAIRTAAMTPAGLGAGPRRARSGHGATEEWSVRYGVGAGIVADSDPASEWRETLLKARVWRGVAVVSDKERVRR